MLFYKELQEALSILQRIGSVKQEKAITLGSIAIVYNTMERAIDEAAVLYDEAGENKDYQFT